MNPRDLRLAEACQRPPTIGEWRVALAAYSDEHGRHRCPCCGAPIRVLSGPPVRVVGVDQTETTSRGWCASPLTWGRLPDEDTP